jgi:hypothetical protein
MMSPNLEKTDVTGYFRDKNTQAILNTNEHEYLAYKAQVEASQRLKSLENDVLLIKQDIAELKNLILNLRRDN